MSKFFGWLTKWFSFKRLYLRIFSSIAFLPSLLGLGLLGLSFLSMYLDAVGVSYKILRHVPFIITQNADTARTLLSTLATGMLSLMVFSFTMVMVVLTMATNNYTPRVLPGLINNRSHQIVLGLYLGTIGFIIMVLINTQSRRYSFEVPQFSVLASAILVFICFVAFVYFIHSISQNIQIGNILDKLFLNCRTEMLKEKKKEYGPLPEDMPGWVQISSPKAGYFQGIDDDEAMKLATKHNVQLLVLPENGKFILEGQPLLKANRTLPEDVVDELLGGISFYHQEHLEVNYLYGFKHITEVAIKALSPGINDPGTAIKAIDYLSQLFIDLMDIGRYAISRDKQDIARLYYYQAPYESVFYLSFTGLRNYATQDVSVQQRLLEMLEVLEAAAVVRNYKTLFQQERKALLANADAVLKNEKDKELLQHKAFAHKK